MDNNYYNNNNNINPQLIAFNNHDVPTLNPATMAAINPAVLAANPILSQHQFHQLPTMSPQDLHIAQSKQISQRQTPHPGAINQYPSQQQPSPSSYYSSSSMPPPQQILPRPPTSMAMAPPRPPTASSSRPGTAAGHHNQHHHQPVPGSSNGYATPIRPPSRPQTAGSNPGNGPAGFGAPQQRSPQLGMNGAMFGLPTTPNGYGSGQQQQFPQMQRSPTPQSQMQAGSPFQGMKRKLTGVDASPQLGATQNLHPNPAHDQQAFMGQTPRISAAGLPGQMPMKPPAQIGMNLGMGMGMGGGMMGGAGGGMMPPPSLPRQLSGDQLQQQTASHMQPSQSIGFPPLNAQKLSNHEQQGHALGLGLGLGGVGQGQMPMNGMQMGLQNMNGVGDGLGASLQQQSSQQQLSAQSYTPNRSSSAQGPMQMGIPPGLNMNMGMGPLGAMGLNIGPNHNPNSNSAPNANANANPNIHSHTNTNANMGMNQIHMQQALQERKNMTAMVHLHQQQQQLHHQQTSPVRPRGGSAVPVPAPPVSAGGGSNVPPLIQNVASGSKLVPPPPPPPPLTPSHQPPSTSGTSTHQQQHAAALLPPLPASVSLNAAVTRVSVVPLAQSLTAIPPLSADEISDIKGWVERDREYENMYRAMRERMRVESAVVGGGGGGKAKWWERDVERERLERERRRHYHNNNGKFEIMYPRSARDIARERRNGRTGTTRREGMRVPKKLSKEDAERVERLVPIRLEFDVEHHRYRDTFVWNLNDPIVTPEAFAQSVVEDYGLASSLHGVITKAIQEQLSDYRTHTAMLTDMDDAPAPAPIVIDDPDAGAGAAKRGELEGNELCWWEAWRRKLRTKSGYVKAHTSVTGQGAARAKKRRRVRGALDESIGEGRDVPMDIGEFVFDEEKMAEEMRILIKLDITVGSMKLDDQFEWDMENVDTTPEQFAEVYGNDLGLTGEFKTAIAHAIREQVQMYQKSLFLVGHPLDGSAIQDDDLRMSFLPSVSSAPRPVDQAQAFTPILNYLSDGELERIDKEREKELNKRRKRNTRGRRGIALPDREPLKTHRTPAIGFPEVDASTLALAAAAAAPTLKRAAAAAASLTIANMVASENGTALVQPSAPVPQAVVPAPSKVAKAKGLFKKPSFPQDVLKARSKVTAPTTSTAADASTFGPPLEGDAPLPASSSSSATLPPDSRASKVVTARRQREIEKEAKEKEFADGQHANIIDGVWHCSNCGCPDSVAIGRRKGPLGDKSQCGACGKFWHRHRRPRPVEYHADAEYHINLKLDAERAKTPAKKRGAAALRALNAAQQEQSPTLSVSTLPNADRDSPAPKHDAWIEGPSPRKGRPSMASDPVDPVDRAMSPASSISSSASERPLAQTVLQVNGIGHKPVSSTNQATSSSTEPPPPQSSPISARGSSRAPPSSSQAPASASEPPASAPVIQTPASAPDPGSAVGTPPVVQPKPQWLENAMAEMQAKYPDDKFDIILRRVNPAAPHEWRVKCLDCPGKLYTPGPGETLSNYEVHLKNRQHRARVAGRVNGTNGAS